VGGGSPGKARPLGTDEIRLLMYDLTTTLAGRRDRAAVLLGYALALRAGDLVTLDVDDLTPDPHGLQRRHPTADPYPTRPTGTR
jgi:integrase